jgi:hypothetical protein
MTQADPGCEVGGKTVLFLVAAKTQKIGGPILFKDLIIGTSSYLGSNSATNKNIGVRGQDTQCIF